MILSIGQGNYACRYSRCLCKSAPKPSHSGKFDVDAAFTSSAPMFLSTRGSLCWLSGDFLPIKFQVLILTNVPWTFQTSWRRQFAQLCKPDAGARKTFASSWVG